MTRRPKARPATDAAAIKVIERLTQTHREEIERINIAYNDRIRRVEVARFQAEEKLEKAEQEFAYRLDRFETEKDRLVADLLSAKEAQHEGGLQAARFEQKVAELVAERDALILQHQQLEEQLKNQRTLYQQSQASIAEQKASLIEASDALELARQDLTRSERLVTARNRQLEQLTSKEKEADAQLAAALNKVKQGEEKLAEQASSIETLRGERDSFKAELEAVRSQQDRLKSQTAAVRSEHDRVKLELSTVSSERDNLKFEIDRVATEHDRLKLKLEMLGSERDALSSERDSLISQQHKLSAELDSHVSALQRMGLAHETDRTRYAGRLGQLSTQLATLQQDAARYRSSLVQAEHRAEAVKDTLSFRLGYAIMHCTRSWSNFVGLPAELWRIRKDAKSRRSGRRGKRGTAESGAALALPMKEDIQAAYSNQGIQAAENLIKERIAKPQDAAAAFTFLARLALNTEPSAAVRLGRLAIELDPRGFRRKWLGFLLFDAGHIVEADELLQSLPDDVSMKTSESNKADFINGVCRLYLNPPLIESASVLPSYTPLDKTVMYVVASSLPYHTTGYTARTHGLLQAIESTGWAVRCVSRPGYPWDRTDALDAASAGLKHVDGIHYEAVQGLNRRKVPLDQYIEKAAQAIEKKALELRPAVIHAASNYEAALPALIAARRLGIPFIYEVRGLWEYTSASRIAEWESTERFALDRNLESLVATHADRVLTLTGALRDELVERGVDSQRITLAPNAVNPDLFLPAQKDASLTQELGLEDATFVIGYVGSIVGYEGLDDLVTAFAQVLEYQPQSRLLIVGDGNAFVSLQRQAQSLGLEDKIRFTGKVSFNEVARYYSLLDVIALPRKLFKVCQLVSPLKPVEAMAMGIPLVVSDVQALKEMVTPGETGLVHTSGDPNSLAEQLLVLANNPSLRQQLAQAAYADMQTNRTWNKVAGDIEAVYTDLQRSPVDVVIGQLSAPQGIDSTTPPADATSAAIEALTATAASNATPQISPTAQLLIPVNRNSLSTEEKALLDKQLAQQLREGGSSSIGPFVARLVQGHSPEFASFCEVKAGNACLHYGDVQKAVQFAELALSKSKAKSTVRSVCKLLYNATHLDRTLALAGMLDVAPVSESDQRFIKEVRGRHQLATLATQPAAQRTIPVITGRVLNVLAFSLPYTSVGYATRSHGLAEGIQNNGWEVRAYTRPGFPYDFKPEYDGQELPLEDSIDDVVYRRIFGLERRGITEVQYLLEATAQLEAVMTREQPEVVHAASNYVTALPAMIAARRLGIPFVYEVRGFWEVTRSSRDSSFVNTPKYRFMQLFEDLLIHNADHVITITGAMRDVLIGKRVPAENISIAYNSVDPTRFTPTARVDSLGEKLGIPRGVPVIGYVGSFVDYEGLDDLLLAAKGLKEEGLDFRLLLVGDGAVFETLKEQSVLYGIEDLVILTGRVPHDEVPHYYSLVDIAPFPRKPWEVCELVSPLKPFEAMAQEKAVVVSSTQALTEIVDDGVNGLVFEKGNPESLKRALAALVADPGLQRRLGQTARLWVSSERNWSVAGKVCTHAYGLARASQTTLTG